MNIELIKYQLAVKKSFSINIILIEFKIPHAEYFKNKSPSIN
jgi:hypothetical protein